jgi:dipeptidyl aminopeptidase/acylaminoacyl peptidase
MTRDGREVRQITPPTNQDKGEFAISPDEKWLAYESIRRCNIDVMVMPLTGGRAVKVSPGDGVSTTPAWSPQGDRILFDHANPTTANELWVTDFPTGEPRRLTYSMMGNLQGVELAVVDPVSFSSFDGTTIDGLLYHPREIPAGARYSALLLIHGGPNAQHYDGWWPLLHYLVGKGYVILAPNCRGSNGYGRAFMDANLNDWAGNDIKDWVHAVAFLKGLGYIDGGRIAIWGRSYGGYATVMALTHLPELFRAGICHFGPTNLSTMWDQSFVRHLQKRMMGLPVENPALNRERSAVPYAEAMQSPVLILQGGADDGVPPAQSEEIVAALKRLGKTYEYYCYEGEGHGFLKLEHVLDAANRIETFLDRYLKG